jgi:8-oxo-dGTP pyrophosphatase MutT (NUDIX family)
MIHKSAHIIVTNSRGLILLTQRRDVPVWVIPGGHVNNRELVVHAAIRELFEETGLRISRAKLIAKYFRKNKVVTKYLYLSRSSRDAIIKKSLETKNAKWCNPNKLPSPISIYETMKIKDFLQSKRGLIIREDKYDLKQELLNQLRNPLYFLWLTIYLIKSQLTKKSFKF